MRSIIALLALALLSSAAPAAEPTDDASQAKAFFEKGMAHFQLEEYDAAIEKWEAGFRIRPVPEFLYNIAQAYRLSRRHDRALSFYQKYLRMSPKAPNRADVEKHIATLKVLVEQNQRVASLPPREPLNQSGRPSPQSAPIEPAPREPGVTEPSQPTNATPSPAEPARADVTARAPAKDTRPITKKPWFWGVIAGGAALVIGAVVVGVVVGTAPAPTQQLPELRF